MAERLLRLFDLLSTTDKRKFYVLQLLVIIMACFELGGLAAIGPFVLLVSDSSVINGDNLISLIYLKGGFDSYSDFVFWWGSAVVAILITGGCISMYTIWVLSMYGQNIGVSLGDRLFRFYINKDWIFHTRERSSLLTKHIIAEANRVKNGIIVPVLQLNARLFAALFISISLLLYEPLKSLAVLSVFAICYATVYSLIAARLSANGTKISSALEMRYHLISEGLGGIRDVLLHRNQKGYSERFKEVGSGLAYNQGEAVALSQMPRYLMEALAFGGVVLLMTYLAGQEGEFSNTLALLSVYALAGLKLLPACQAIYANLSTIKSHLPAFDAIEQDLLDLRNDADSGEKRGAPKIRLDHMREKLSLKGVYFRYPGKEAFALNDVTMDINCKSVIGIAGPSGSGKSTLMDIILGLLEPDRGAFMLDGALVGYEHLAFLRSGFSCVSQSIFLSDTTITENVAFGVPNELIDHKLVDQALAQADLGELINSMPQGKETLVGENAVQLSGGQRQRLGIARALYRNAEVLIFDEATSSLDGESEQAIMRSIHKFSGIKTVIIVAHRLSTLKDCDVIYFMQDGRILDFGSYPELVRSHDFFSQVENQVIRE